jgi:uncharacterized membrane protein YdjX (TVP38/TMEM64 family)
MAIFSYNQRMKFILGCVWIVVILLMALYLFLNPQVLTVEYLTQYLKRYEANIWLAYVALLIFRCFVLIPPSPFLFLGLVLFPESSWIIILVTLGSILLSSSFCYFFAKEMGWHLYFQKRYPKYMNKIELQLNKPKSIFFVMIWAFMPVFPTDLICYVAGVVGMPFRILVTGIVIGQLPMLYIYSKISGLLF